MKENALKMDCCELGPKRNEWRTLYKTDNFFVMPSIGGMGRTYLLVCSNKHYAGIGGTPSGLYAELLDTLNATRRVMQQVNGREPLMFEHGPSVHGVRGGGCIDHMHVHAVDTKPISRELAGDLTDSLSEHGEMYRVDVAKEFERLAGIVESEQSSYFWVEEGGRRLVAEVRIKIPSQFARRIIARNESVEQKCGPGAWDWAANPDMDTLHKTLERLHGKF